MGNLVQKSEGHVALLQLHRPDRLNALSIELMDELIRALETFDQDDNVRVIILHGDERAFAAGADIGDMAEASLLDMYRRNNLARWNRIRQIRKPVIAAVSGFCLGGGCELAMLCDMIVASESAQFGQPEINIGVIPGAGGTQRLTRAIGKARAMEMILTGRFMSAREAFEAGLVSKVVAKEQYLAEALRLAQEIAKKAPIAVRMAKEAVNKAHELSLTEGIEFERRVFYMLFATADQKEGMKAFLEKRPANYEGK
ncbi:MAG: enoyl-CoA hydratase/isomerase family protein [Phycisphaerae bacterium]|nr:enoyl-CoA hydratase/isomerase family protein [Phycisphaerae bacterium]